MKNDPHFLYHKAKRTIQRQLGFIIHISFFTVVNILLFFVNFLVTPEKVWWPYPFLSWGLAIYIHFLFAFIFHDDALEKEKQRFGSTRKAEAVLQFGFHFLIYLGICFFLYLIDVISGDRYFWSIWVILGWGIGVLAHAISVYIFTSSTFRDLAANIRGSDLIETRFFLKLHFILFLVANGLLLLVSWLLFSKFELSFWVCLGWGIGLFCHALWTVINRGHRIKKWRQKKTLELMEQLKESE